MARRPCLDCPALAMPGDSRCHRCHHARRRATYEHPDFRAWGKPGGTCSLRIKCDGAPSTTWDHIDGDNTNHDIANRGPACVACNSSKQGERH